MTNKEYKDHIIQKFKERNTPKDGFLWQTFNDQLNTRLFDQPGLDISQSDLVKLDDQELPLLECQLPPVIGSSKIF